MGSSLVPPLRKLAYLVMSSLPLGFLAPWQPKQFSLRTGATSLMKLTGPAAGGGGGGSAAAPVRGASRKAARARAAPRVTQSTQKQNRDRESMAGGSSVGAGSVVGE